MEEIRFGRKSETYACFSNFHECENGVTMDGIKYRNTEAAFQAQKTVEKEERKKFENLNGSEAKRLGRRVKLRSDWEEIKDEEMKKVVLAKFEQNPDLKEVLLSTGDAELVENTTGWHDNYWGDCQCEKCKKRIGRNQLGKTLVEVREILRY